MSSSFALNRHGEQYFMMSLDLPDGVQPRRGSCLSLLVTDFVDD